MPLAYTQNYAMARSAWRLRHRHTGINGLFHPREGE